MLDEVRNSVVNYPNEGAETFIYEGSDNLYFKRSFVMRL